MHFHLDIFTTGNAFVTSRFAFQYDEVHQKLELHLKERMCSSKMQIFSTKRAPLRNRCCQKTMKCALWELASQGYKIFDI